MRLVLDEVRTDKLEDVYRVARLKMKDNVRYRVWNDVYVTAAATTLDRVGDQIYEHQKVS